MKLRRLGLLVGVGAALLVVISALATSSNGSVPDSTGDVGRYTSLELDSQGYPVVSYYDITNGDLKLLHCGSLLCDSGNSITSPDTAGDVGAWTSLELDGQGYPVISYYDGTNEDLKLLHCNDPDCSGGDDTAVTVDSAGSVGSSLALDANDNPVISYRDANKDLKVVHCGDPTCTAGNVFATPADVKDGQANRSAIVLDSSGNPVVAFRVYFEFPYGYKLYVLRCGDPNCQSANSLESAGFGGESNAAGLFFGKRGEGLSLVLDSDGFPVLSHEVTDKNGIRYLQVIRCVDEDCDGASMRSDIAQSKYGYTSIALSSEGLPVVAYYGAVDGDLQLLRCTRASCDANNRIIFADVAGDVGTFGSLALDDDGYPVVSYFDLTNGDLKILRCENVLCGVGDSDGDGCSDDAELQTGSPESGGDRDPKNPWDFYDVSGSTFDNSATAADGFVDLPNDILGVILHFSPQGAPPYDVAFDRGPSSGPNPWNMTAPDGAIDLPNDVLGVILQSQHSCQ